MRWVYVVVSGKRRKGWDEPYVNVDVFTSRTKAVEFCKSLQLRNPELNGKLWIQTWLTR